MGVVFDTPYSHLLKGLDPEQVRAVAAPPTPLVVVAGAGSGKTTVLVRRIAMLAARGMLPPRTSWRSPIRRRRRKRSRIVSGGLMVPWRPSRV